MDKVLGDRRAIALFVLPTLLLFLFIIISPIFFSGYYSLLKWDGIGKSTYIGFQNYLNLFVNNQDGFIRSIGNSSILAFLSVFIQLPISLILALVLARGVKGENFYRTTFFMPVIVSTVVIGQLWLKIYNPDYGLLNTILRDVGLESWTANWLGDMNKALLAAFIPILWQYTGYHMLLMYAAAKSVSEEIYDSARMDGASSFLIAVKITIPMIKSMIKVCLIFAVIGSFKVFDLVYVLTKGGPLHATEVPATLMYTTIFNQYQYGYGSAMSIFIIVQCLVFTLVLQKIIKEDL
ncbi:sugar ABC transporter permease [Paenibacillus psychroresistens]|uniref:Sugar ABC transporter permease n=1 Tax=Paenibacillus psychroresistens TaxID=1778678 RepID=A0A6B8RQQ3_9BACL|nr:sugar ABC transporter permease [Paenibacillus psychroresistens]QGQ97716.1 sugar ABC transporter permease [Paenibacillus psychroresistens]